MYSRELAARQKTITALHFKVTARLQPLHQTHSIRTAWCVANSLMFSIFHQCFQLFSSWQWFCWRTRLLIFSQSHLNMAINHLSNDSSRKDKSFFFLKNCFTFCIFYFHCSGRMVTEKQPIPFQSPPRILECTINHFAAISSYMMYFRYVGIILMGEKKMIHECICCPFASWHIEKFINVTTITTNLIVIAIICRFVMKTRINKIKIPDDATVAVRRVVIRRYEALANNVSLQWWPSQMLGFIFEYMYWIRLPFGHTLKVPNGRWIGT